MSNFSKIIQLSLKIKKMYHGSLPQVEFYTKKCSKNIMNNRILSTLQYKKELLINFIFSMDIASGCFTINILSNRNK